MKKIAEAYIAAWNETDAGRRGELLDAAFTPDISYREPLMQGDEHKKIAALIDGVHGQFPGFRFALKGEPDGFADKVRFHGRLGRMASKRRSRGRTCASLPMAG